MTAKKRASLVIMVFLAAVLLAGAFAGGYFVGRNSRQPVVSGEQSDIFQQSEDSPNCEVIYAEIISVSDGFFHVKGLDVNDINGRGEFTFSAKENTRLIWRGTEISLSDFQPGDRIAFYWDGLVLDSFPGQVQNVVRIKLLEDEL